MRILVHDFAGHAFAISLSRELARRGHGVDHAYCASLVTTPQGALQRREDDPPGLQFHPIDLGEPLQKTAFLKRWRQERRYGRLAARLVEEVRPDVVLSGQTPLDAQGRLLRATHRIGARYVFWVQDLIGVASAELLRDRIPLIGGLAGDHYARLERKHLRASDALVLITEDFEDVVPVIAEHPHRDVIPNWAPIEDIPLRPRENAWAAEHGLGDRLRFVYSGTLGMKHNPALLLALARHRPDADVLVISQGAGADWLREEGSLLPNLRVLPFQPQHRLPDVLGAGDVLVAILEPGASRFSVPSKVLSYLGAGRAMLLAVPAGNLVARIVRSAGAGLVTAPLDGTAFLAAADRLASDPDFRHACAQRARRYAESAFDLGEITNRFEALLIDCS
jgi:colanic acid biosynthesis glycosyl transferase WcaI